MNEREKKKPRLNGILFAMLLEELIAGPSTWQELSEHTGLSRNTILNTLQALRKRKLVYVAAWEKDPRGAATMRAYAFGDKPDMKRPRRTPAETKREYRARKVLESAMRASAGVPMQAGA